MKRAIRAADAAGVPWVLDPVAVGATPYRTEAALSLVRRRPAIVRGNASEILALSGDLGAVPKGPDSAHGSDAARDPAKALAVELGAVEIGRAHVCTPVTNAHLGCRLLLENIQLTNQSTNIN